MADEREIDGVLRVTADTTGLDQQLKKSEKVMEDFAKKAESASKRVDDSLSGLGDKGRSGMVSQRIGIRKDAELGSIYARSSARLAEEESRRATRLLEAQQRRETQAHQASLRRQPAGFLGRGGMGSRMLGGLATGLGIGTAGFGAFAAVQAARAVIDSTKLAAAYQRQEIAAEGLAGSQAQLNALLAAYNDASGGAVSKATALANVTRLLATGFAKTVPEAERFVRATRGASIALGRPQEEVTQETQLAISNTSVKRLDQIGLGIEEVNAKVEELRETNSGWTREMAFQGAVLAVMEDKYGHLTQTVEGQATGVERLASAWDDFMLALGQGASGPINRAAEALSKLLKLYTEAATPESSTPTQRMPGGSRTGELTRLQRFDEGFNQWMNQRVFESQQFILGQMARGGADTSLLSTQIRAQRALETGEFRTSDRGDSGYSDYRPPTPGPRFTDEQRASIRDFERQQLAIEENYQAQRLAATEQYESQRASTIRNYEKQIAREAEDFAIRRARSERDYNKQREDLIENAAKRDAETTEDYNDRVSDARENADKNLAKLEEKYHDDREKREKEHLDRMMEAAGSLDAIALLNERKRWKRENEEREDAHRDQVAENRESLNEQLEDAREAYEERLADAREADQERLDDMAENRRQQLADEDEDRAIQRERAAEDHNDQLAEMDRQHGLRMKQIEDQAAKEREQWNQEFEDFLIEHNIYVKGLTEKREKADKLTEGWFDTLIERLEKELEFEKKMRSLSPEELMQIVPGGAYQDGYASGGRVRRSGPAILHAGEFVLSRGMLSGSQPVPAGVAAAVGGNSKVITVGDVNVMVAPGREREVGELLEDQLIEILDRLGN